MFQHQGIYLPDGEKHFPEWMSRNGEIVNGRGTYQMKKIRATLEHCKNFRNAVDVGAHVGLWSMQLVRKFAWVHAFEPVAAFRECWERNLAPTNFNAKLNASLYDCALGKLFGKVQMLIDPADTGGTHVETHLPAEGKGVDMRPLDHFYEHLNAVDLIKIDCEGYEDAVLEGSVKVLRQWLPTIIVEQKPRKLEQNYGTKGKPAVDFLLGLNLGYILRREMGGDFILSVDA